MDNIRKRQSRIFRQFLKSLIVNLRVNCFVNSSEFDVWLIFYRLILIKGNVLRDIQHEKTT